MGNPTKSSSHTPGLIDGSASGAEGLAGDPPAEHVRAQRGATSHRDPFTLDLQTLLAPSVVRLRDVAQMPTAVAWALRPDGAPYVAAASFDAGSPASPSRADFAELSALDTPRQLDSSPALVELAQRHRLSAAALVRGPEDTPLAVLLVGPGTARPRVLASLGGAARRLEIPLAAAMAAGRFRELDRDVRRLDRLAALGKLTAEIAHEVRNPLVSVKTFLQLLPERLNDPEFVTDFLSVATQELGRVERLLDVLIHAPRSTAGNESTSNPRESLDTLAELLRHPAQTRGVTIEVEWQGDLPLIAMSQDALRQALLNVTKNAIAASPHSGRVRLAARAYEGGVELRVTDDGPGVLLEDRERIFEPFVRLDDSPRGAGIGLFAARHLARSMGGRLSVEPRDPKGTQFVLRLRFVGPST